MSVLYLISLLFTPWYEKTVHHNIAHALFCIADALWLAVISKILGKHERMRILHPLPAERCGRKTMLLLRSDRPAAELLSEKG